MLKNTREYLEEERNFFYETLNEHQDDLTQRKEEYEEAKKLKEAFEDKNFAKNKLFGRFMFDGIFGCALINIFLYSGVPLLAVIIIILSILHIGFSVKKVINTSKNFKKVYEESNYSYKIFFKKKNADYKRFFKIRYEEYIAELENWIKNNKEYANVLWELLSNDDFIEMLEKYHEYWIVVEALKSELEAYIDEISKIRPQDIHFDGSEYIKVEPVSLNYSNNQEKKYNLTTK